MAGDGSTRCNGGSIPFWAKDATIGRRLINARLDSLAAKPAFREAWKRRRCLIPASGFYEWSEPEAAVSARTSSAQATSRCWRSRVCGNAGELRPARSSRPA